MSFFKKNKRKNNRKILFLYFAIMLLIAGFFRISFAQVAPQINISAYLTNDKNEAIVNGEYEIRFSIYTKDRNVLDPFPSDSDSASRVWSENQKIYIRDGVLSAYLGSVNSLPENFNFNNNQYYIGIRISTDSEMIPRKKIGSVPMAMSASSLLGAVLGTNQGNIPQLGSGGKLDIKMLPTGEGSNELVLGDDARFDNVDDIHLQNTDQGTTNLSFNLGNNSSLNNNFDLNVSNSAQKPALRFNGNLSQWQYSNDGKTFSSLGTIGNIDASQITTGILNVSNGGTGIGNYTLGDILYANSSSTLQKLSIGSSGQVLSIVNGIPTWQTVSGVSIPQETDPIFSASISASINSSNVLNWNTAFGWGNHLTQGYITDGNTNWDNSYGFITASSFDTLTNKNWNGNQIGINYGGTGLSSSSYSRGDLLFYNSGTTLDVLNSGNVNNGKVLVVSGGIPTWSETAPTYPHNLLNAAEHPDTTTGPPVQGDIIVANNEDLWSRLAVGTSGNVILTNNGTDVFWNSVASLELATLNGTETLLNKNIGTGSNYQGNTIATSYGGTGINTYYTGSIIYASGADTLTTLAAGADSSYLSISGGIPAWRATTNITTLGTITSGTWNATTIGIAYGGTGATTASGARTNLGLGTLSTLSSINNSNWSGTQLSILNGGTGTTNGSITGTGELTFATSGINNNIVLTPNGTGIVSINSNLGIKAGSYKTIIEGNTAQANDIVYTLPSSYGNIGQVLTTDSSGNLSWENVVGGVGGIGTVTSVGSGYGISGGPITTSGILSINLLSVNGGSALVESSSGLQFSGISNNQLALLQGCSNNEVLSWDDVNNVWKCASVSGVGGITGSGINGYVAYWSGSSTLSSEQYLSLSRGGTGAPTASGARTNLGLGSVDNVSILNWTGSGNITNVGTIGSGSWQGGVITPTYGGTGINTYNSGDLLYANGTSTMTTLGAGIGNTGRVLMVNAAGLPVWNATATATAHSLLNSIQHSDTTTATVQQGDLIYGNSSIPTSKWDRLAHGSTNDILTYNGSNIAWNSFSGLGLVTTNGTQILTNKTISGAGSNYQGNAITTSYGGTGLTSFSAGDILYYNSGVTLSQLTKGAEGTVLSISGGLPVWSSTAPPAAHKLLNSIQHPDTNTADVLRGALITGQGATPLWSLLGPGTSGQILRSNGSGADISWISLTKSDIGLGSVENTPLSTWTGSTTITTLGTIGTGTWGGNIINVSKGGTGTSSQFTQGALVFAGASGVYSQDNINLFWDDTNNRLGIGTVTPGAAVQVNSILSASSGREYGMIINPTSNQSGTAGYSTLYINSTNNTTGSGYRDIIQGAVNGTTVFEVSSNGAVTSATGIENNNSENYASFKTFTNGPIIRRNIADSNPALIVNQAFGGVASTGDILRLQYNGLNKMVVDYNGNVGIGDATPASLFTVGTNDAFQINSSGTITSGTWNATKIEIPYGGTGATTASGARTNLGLGTLSTLSSINNSNWSGTQLSILNGGTGTTSIGTSGAIAYSNGTSYAFSSNFMWNNSGQYMQIGSTPFSMGIDTGDNNKFKINTGSGISGSGIFSIGTDGVTSIGSLNMGTQEFEENAGVISWIDMSVTNSASNGTIESYSASIDGNPLLTIFGRSNGSGGVTNLGVGIGTTTPAYKLDVQGGTGVNADKVNSRWGYLTNGADYAEYFYTNDINLESGDVVCVDMQNNNSIKGCDNAGDNNVMGIVSTNPSIIGNGNGQERENDPKYKIIGMLGQVPGKVSSENGSIQIGDNLTSASIKGYMRKANAGESTVGVAMQNFSEERGFIQVLISRRNQSLTVEKVEEAVTQNIANMNIKDQVDKMVADASIILDEQVSLNESRFTSLETLTSKLQKQMEEIKSKMDTELNLAQIDLNKQDISYLKMILGINENSNPGDILISGKMKAKIVDAGKLIISIDNEDERTIGEGKILSIKKDEDLDLKDDETLSDGKTVFIKTKAIGVSSKVFITPKVAIEQGIAVTEIKFGEGFLVSVKNSLNEDVQFDWVVVDEK